MGFHCSHDSCCSVIVLVLLVKDCWVLSPIKIIEISHWRRGWDKHASTADRTSGRIRHKTQKLGTLCRETWSLPRRKWHSRCY